jgi:high-affinity K+ transport system ATPase subunit B
MLPDREADEQHFKSLQGQHSLCRQLWIHGLGGVVICDDMIAKGQ